MRQFWRRDDENSDIERRLRDERPAPSGDLVRRVARNAGETSGSRRLSLGLAYSVTGLFAVALIALGGFGSPIDTAERFLSFESATSSYPDKGKPAKDEYEEKVTICHRPPGNPRNGQTLRLPKSAAYAHLRNHLYDSRGPCKRKGGGGYDDKPKGGGGHGDKPKGGGGHGDKPKGGGGHDDKPKGGGGYDDKPKGGHDDNGQAGGGYVDNGDHKAGTHKKAKRCKKAARYNKGGKHKKARKCKKRGKGRSSRR